MHGKCTYMYMYQQRTVQIRLDSTRHTRWTPSPVYESGVLSLQEQGCEGRQSLLTHREGGV